MAGRPAIFNAELGAEVERRVASGQSLRAIEQDTGLSARTIGRWLKEGLVKRVPAKNVEVTALLAQDEPALVGMVARAGEHDWRAAAWLLERRWPGRWRLRERVRHEAEPEPRLDPADPFLEVDELARRRRTVTPTTRPRRR